MFWRLTAFVRQNIVVLCLVLLFAVAAIVFSCQNRTSFSYDGDFAVTTDVEMDLKYPKKIAGDDQNHSATTADTPSTPLGHVIVKKYLIKRCAGLSIFGRGHNESFSAEFPEFQGQSPFLFHMSQKLKDEYHAAGIEFATFDLALVYEGLRSGAAVFQHWDKSISLDLVHLTPQSVSLLETHYEYTGGAHGNAYFMGRSFVEHNGSVRELVLDELFDPQSEWSNRLIAHSISDLRVQGASSIPEPLDDESESHVLTLDELHSFTLSTEGLRFYFSPYHVGSYAEGMFNVRVPYSVVIDCIPESSLIRFFMATEHD